jgi:hypothetical protein
VHSPTSFHNYPESLPAFKTRHSSIMIRSGLEDGHGRLYCLNRRRYASDLYSRLYCVNRCRCQTTCTQHCLCSPNSDAPAERPRWILRTGSSERRVLKIIDSFLIRGGHDRVQIPASCGVKRLVNNDLCRCTPSSSYRLRQNPRYARSP